ncbi:trans-4-hydroxy-L-proline dehydratase activase [Clostridium sulfidigenes]|uniref:trans-4-hydroxy-L-proline dehydratase activase n=1 Tax=Clostridium sulfidigenes TaxID=318464 RepID=UPI003F8B9205
MNLPKIINIQKYSIHDGNGIRTTIFFKGCPLSCLWCHNPESQNYSEELMYNEEKCTGCMACIDSCPQRAISKEEKCVVTDKIKCDLCKECIDYCVNNAREIVGKEYTVAQLVKEAEKDRMFYEESSGGITLSGGEVMTQNMDYIEELLKKLKKKGYNIAIDTCGQAPYENYNRILKYVDTFLYDIKLMDNEKHIKYIGKSNNLILENLKKLSEAGANINIRIPLVEGVNADDESIEELIKFLKKNINVHKINLLPYHNTGKSKYERLQKVYEGVNFEAPSKERMETVKGKFEKAGFINIKIGG